jgi:hypothetical protein
MSSRSFLFWLTLILVISEFEIFIQVQAQNQPPRFEPALQSNYFFYEFNATRPGFVILACILIRH